MAEPDLREAWVDLLQRRPTLAPSLTVYGDIIESWARWSPPRPLGLTLRREACCDSWERGIPLTADAAGALQIGDVEELVGGAMEALVRAQPSLAPGFQRFAEAWDAGWLGPQTLLPDVGRVGSDALEKATGLSSEVVAVVATVGMRPALEALFAPVREHLTEGAVGPRHLSILRGAARVLGCHRGRTAASGLSSLWWGLGVHQAPLPLLRHRGLSARRPDPARGRAGGGLRDLRLSQLSGLYQGGRSPRPVQRRPGAGRGLGDTAFRSDRARAGILAAGPRVGAVGPKPLNRMTS